MPKLRIISGKKLVKVFESFGFVIVKQKGSHIKMHRVYSGVKQVLVIPNHTAIAKGTLNDVYKQALEYFSESDLKNIFFV